MTVLREILDLVDKVQSQDDLRKVSSAVTARWRLLQGVEAQKAVQDKGLLTGDGPGQPVSFMHGGKMTCEELQVQKVQES